MFTIENLWVSPQWKDRLDAAGLLDIEAVAKRDHDWFEEPNRRRGGWSGVTRIVLNPDASAEDQQAVFLKIQQNHFYRDPAKLFKKRLTFEREFDVLQRLGSTSDSVPELVFFAKWRAGADTGSILVTKALDHWLPLPDWLCGKNGLTAPDEPTLLKALEAIAATSRRINDAGWVHLSYSAKHLFVMPQADGSFKSCVIDLEKCRKHILSGHRTIKDCSQFMRHTPNLTDAQKLSYLKAYFQTETFSTAQQRLIRRIPGAPRIR
jgi:hypothetical protein